MKLLIVLGILLGGSYSFANFQGVWQGDAIMTLRDGRTAYCDEIIIHVSHGKDKMEFGNFRYACGEFAINFTPPVLILGQKKFTGQETYWKEAKVGKISSTKADLFFVVSEAGRARYTVRKTSNDEMSYIDEQISINAEGKEEITEIKATLKRVAQ